MIESKIVIPKQPSEKIFVAMDFSKWVTTAETLSAPVVTHTPSGLTTTAVAVNGRTVEFFVAGGVVGTRYRVSVTVNSDSGENLEGDGKLKVEGR